MKRVVSTLVIGLLVWLLPEWWRAYTPFCLKRDTLLLALWVAAVAAGVLAGRFRARSDGREPRFFRGRIPVEAWILGALLLLVSLDTFAHLPRFYFMAWDVRLASLGTLLRSGPLQYVVLTGLAAACLVRWDPKRWLGRALWLLLVAGQVACAAMLWRTTGGQAVYSDDHPSFLFRLAEFWGAFPWRENYVPHWNAGVVNSVLVSSGTPGYAWIAAPLWWLAEPHIVHTAALILVFIVLVPWVNVWALRTLGLGRDGALAGGLLALMAGRHFHVWLLHFGTVGAALSWAMAPAAFAFLHAVAVHRRTNRSAVLGLALTMFFAAQWPPTLAVCGIFTLIALIAAGRWRGSRAGPVLLGSGLLVAALLAHSLLVIVGGKDLLGYTLEGTARPSSGVLALLRQFQRGVGLAVPELHPIIFAFGVAGAVALPWKRLRRWTCAALLAIALVFTLGPVYAPRLQLERMAIAASCLAIVPASCWLRRIWSVRNGARASLAVTGLQAATLALLLLGVVNTMRIYAGQGFAPFTGMRPSVRHIAEWVQTHVPEDGRLALAGLAVHVYGRGHVAYLPILAGREMMACDYYGFPPGMVEMDFPPRAARAAPGGLHGYLKLHGVSHVITFHDHYIEHFRSRPEQFQEVAHIDSEEKENFTVFEVLGSGGRFLEGTGTVHARFNRWDVTFQGSPPETAVIAYNWNDRLRVAPPAEIYPHDTGMGPTFIGIRPNGANTVHIRFKNRF